MGIRHTFCMSLTIIWILQTIVLMQSFASPGNKLTPEKSSVNANEKIIHEISKEDVNITDVSVPAVKEQSIKYYPFLNSGSPRLGILFNSENIKEPSYLLGFTYMFPKYKSPQIEIGFDLLNNNTGFLQISKRYIINERQYFRPYYKWGGAILMMPETKLAGLFAIQNYYLRLSVGLEDLLKPPMSVRIELEASIGAKLYFALNFGYSWGW